MKRKGFVMSLVVVSYIMLIILLSTTLQNSHLSMERALREPQPLMYAAAFFDDVGYDVNEIAGPDITITERNNSVDVFISDTIPKGNFSGKLDQYEDFIEGTFAGEIHATVQADFDNLTDGTLEMYINENYLYQNNYNGSNEILFRGKSGSTNVSVYEINITVANFRESIEDFEWDDGEQDVINVTFIYSDYNGTDMLTGQLDPSETNRFKIFYVGNETPMVEIIIGNVDGNVGALWIKEQNTTVDFSFYTGLPLPDPDTWLGYRYDAVMNYSLADVSKTGYIRR